MREALAEAEAAGLAGELPIGAVLVVDGKVVSRGRAGHRGGRRQLAHAEMRALLAGGDPLWERYEHGVLFTTVEPCPMCLGATVMADVPHVVFAIPDTVAGSRRIVETIPYVRRHIETYLGGVLEDESRALLARFDPTLPGYIAAQAAPPGYPSPGEAPTGSESRDAGRGVDFPDRIAVVIEQPPGEEYRLEYDPRNGSFRRTPHRSLVYERGFTGAYGWIAGLGAPPGRHCDVVLITRRSLRPGDLVPARTVGIFYRSDGDHKLVALDDALRETVAHPDLTALDPAMAAEVRALYPRISGNEGWWGAEEARAYLRRWDAPGGAAPGFCGRPVWGPASTPG
jgi:tRNA(adenine34) deaminase